MNTSKIGWIGLGTMGNPMSQQLINAGYPVKVYNRSKDKEQILKDMGATAASSPAELIAETDIVFIMVTDDDAIKQIFTGDNGLFAAEISGKIVVNMSTVSPGINQEYAAQCKSKGAQYLDAPVSGSVVQAKSAQLVIIAGGEEATFDQVKPILEKLGKLALRVGDNGAGNAAKLVVNSLLAIYAQGLAEAVLLANQNNIKTEYLLTILNNSALSNIFTKIKGEAILANNYQPAFSLKNIVKDLSLAKNEGLGSPLGIAALETYSNASSSFGDEDLIAILKHLDQEQS